MLSWITLLHILEHHLQNCYEDMSFTSDGAFVVQHFHAQKKHRRLKHHKSLFQRAHWSIPPIACVGISIHDRVPNEQDCNTNNGMLASQILVSTESQVVPVQASNVFLLEPFLPAPVQCSNQACHARASPGVQHRDTVQCQLC